MPCGVQFCPSRSESPFRRQPEVREVRYLDVRCRWPHVVESPPESHNRSGVRTSRSDLHCGRLATARHRCIHEMMRCTTQSDPFCSYSPCLHHDPVGAAQFSDLLWLRPHLMEL